MQQSLKTRRQRNVKIPVFCLMLKMVFVLNRETIFWGTKLLGTPDTTGGNLDTVKCSDGISALVSLFFWFSVVTACCQTRFLLLGTSMLGCCVYYFCLFRADWRRPKRKTYRIQVKSWWKTIDIPSIMRDTRVSCKQVLLRVCDCCRFLQIMFLMPWCWCT